MHHLAVLAAACLACLLSAPAVRAQTPVATQEGYAYCSVTDTGSAQARIWASPSFAFRYRSDDPGGFQRLNAIAGDFLAQVNALGGAGTKTCEYAASRADADAARAQHRAIWDKRVYFVKIGDWREVPWTPAPWDPAREAAVPAQLTRYFTCSAVQTDVPGRVARSRALGSQVFSVDVPGNEPASMYTRALAYAVEFKAVALAHGVADVNPNCIPFDTRAEADKSLRDQRRLLDGFNQDYQEIAWTPSLTTPAASGDGASVSSGMASTAPLASNVPMTSKAAATATSKPHSESPSPSESPPEPPSPSASASATAPVAASVQPAATGHDAALYCAAFVSRTKPTATSWRAPAQAQSDASTEPTRLAATLARYLQSVQQANPGKWFELKPATCYPNNAVFAGETFCFTAEYKHFGGMQSAGMFCNASREQIDKRVLDMAKADGGHAQVVAWPQ
ncbi:hypothetical protein [Pseudoxanthomonas indica]|uniref:Uncharacterized protein n=1 Tax=Pseudoxanthomonas indica TaxID=428993 RepID=A0A1T5KM86_9GAMM|nr:hypothetical protein [Pseudoxanthomonas indica]GGD49977.1 hypothetical protein GCM10007235_22480 [Pseudoxanthomonas indica]SKC64398.1 hypothetical protein SAMN06296058_1796 [Pseudoxanthomonas indica]